MKLFYDHLIIDLQKVFIEVNKLEIETKSKSQLINLVDKTTHHHILDTILKSLDKKHHRQFLTKFYANPNHPQNLKFLKDKIEDIEEKIKVSAKKLQEIFLAEFS